jgi:hypothetical protein
MIEKAGVHSIHAVLPSPSFVGPHRFSSPLLPPPRSFAKKMKVNTWETSIRSIQSDAHVGERDRYEVVDVDTAREEFRLAVFWHELGHQVGSDGEFYETLVSQCTRCERGRRLTLLRKVEQGRHLLPTRHLDVGDPQIVKEGMAHRCGEILLSVVIWRRMKWRLTFNRSQSSRGRVFQ